MKTEHLPVDPELRTRLVDHTYGIVGCIHYVYETLGCGLPEYVYQEALAKYLSFQGFTIHKEYIHHPIFMGEELESYIKMDLVVDMPNGNVIIECKAISRLTPKEQYQIFGYLRGTGFPIALLVNFGTYPKAEIQRYFYKEGLIRAF